MHPEQFNQLTRAASGDLNALHAVVPVIYPELRRIAEWILHRDRAGKWVGADSLVHAALIRLLESREIDVADRARLLALLATMMRHQVVDIVRAHEAAKRGGFQTHVSLGAGDLPADRPINVIEIEDALVALQAVMPECARVVELRIWADMPLDDIAVAMKLTPNRARESWRLGKAWLRRQLAGSEAADE